MLNLSKPEKEKLIKLLENDTSTKSNELLI